MKILKIDYRNIGLFSNGFSIDFTAVDRVVDDEHVFNVFNRIYTQNLIGIIGINATGKSTALKLIRMAMDIVLLNKGLNDIDIPKGIIVDGTILEVVYFHSDKIYKIESTIGTSLNQEFIFKSEVVSSKLKSSVGSKKALFDFSDAVLELNRDGLSGEGSSFLKDQDSIITPFTKGNTTRLYDMIFDTNFNFLKINGSAHLECINLFDDSIESLTRNDKEIKVRFKSDDVAYESDSLIGSHSLLSSGTIKGVNLLDQAKRALENGGYLVIDEIENHMHKKLVQTIMNFFTDESINKNGATMIFTTHYAEIIDYINRKDNIYVLVRNNQHVSDIKRYSDLISRNDIKKSEIYLSNYIDGTAPSYESIKRVRDYFVDRS
jgi:ABC-type polar amino acid transport system ATPase subunit